MKLIGRIIIRVTLLMLVILPLWGFFFYRVVISEVNDETDDNLELYAEQIIRGYLSGKDLPTETSDVTNNSYAIEQVDRAVYGDYCVYDNEMVYIAAKGETEPARVLRIAFSDAAGDTFLLTVRTPTLEKEDLILAILNWVAILFLGLLLVIVAILAVVLSRSMKPLHRLLRWVDEYHLGEEVVPLENKTSISEFRRLNDAVKQFAARNEKLFLQQKQFIGNASHELQTPIAVCKNRLEILCNMDLTEAQMTEVLKTLKTLEYLSRLNKSLLFLTKIDNRQFIEQSELNIGKVLGKCMEDYTEVYAYKNISVEVDSDDSLPRVAMNQTLAIALISNLLRNAFIHNHEDGTICASLSDGVLSIANTGQTEPLDQNRIFERFWHTSQNEGSTGLGLSIVRSIVEYYNFELTYAFQDGKHVFSINFSKGR